MDNCLFLGYGIPQNITLKVEWNRAYGQIRASSKETESRHKRRKGSKYDWLYFVHIFWNKWAVEYTDKSILALGPAFVNFRSSCVVNCQSDVEQMIWSSFLTVRWREECICALNGQQYSGRLHYMPTWYPFSILPSQQKDPDLVGGNNIPHIKNIHFQVSLAAKVARDIVLARKMYINTIHGFWKSFTFLMPLFFLILLGMQMWF